MRRPPTCWRSLAFTPKEMRVEREGFARPVAETDDAAVMLDTVTRQWLPTYRNIMRSSELDDALSVSTSTDAKSGAVASFPDGANSPRRACIRHWRACLRVAPCGCATSAARTTSAARS